MNSRPLAPSYHHGNLRAALVEEGLTLAREQGADGVVLREVARRVGVSHNAAYRHFADRAELLDEIADRSMARLMEVMRERLDEVPSDLDPVTRARTRLRELGRSYVHFAIAEPGLFRVAFAAKEMPSDDDANPFGVLGSVLDELVRVGWVAPARRPAAAIGCWAAVHGVAVLVIDGPLADVPPDERELALDQLLLTVDIGLGPAASLDHQVNDR